MGESPFALAPELGKRFKLVDVIPSVAAGAILAFLFSRGQIIAGDNGDIWRLSGIVVAASVLMAVIVRPFQRRLVRLFEGYWSDRPLAAFFFALGVERHKAKRARLTREKDRGLQIGASQVQQERGDLAREFLRRYPEEDRMLPTMLGNTLRAAEDRAGGRYGMDFTWAMPRLYAYVGSNLKDEFDNAVDQYDSNVRLTASLAVTSIISAGALPWRYGWWALLPLVGLVLASVSYHGAVEAASHFGEFLMAMFDLHRFDLLTAFHVRLPTTPSTEYGLNQDINEFFLSWEPGTFFPVTRYVHADIGIQQADRKRFR